MPLARIILSMSQRCSSKRRTRGGPRRSRMGGKPCCGRFIPSSDGGPAVAPADRAACGSIIGAAHALLSTTLRLSSAARFHPWRAAPDTGNALFAPSPHNALPFGAKKEADPMKLAVPDMISNSYFPAEAAVELGFFKAEGLDVTLELIFPVDKAYVALRDGAVDFVGGSAHSALAAFPGFRGAKLLCAQAQGMYWFLIMHADIKAKRGDLSAVKGRSIGAAPWVDKGLRGLLTQCGS